MATEKPAAEERKRVRHHMVDIAEVSETVAVAEFQRRARVAIDEIWQRGTLPLVVGGSGLYFRAVVDPLQFPGTEPAVRARFEEEAGEEGAEALYGRLRAQDPQAADRIQPGNTRRVVRALEVIELTGRPFSSFRTGWDEYASIYDLRAVGLTWPREELDRRIDARVDDYLARGLVEEVKELEASGLRASPTSVQALGYAQVLRHLDGELSKEEAIHEIKRRTRKFARRQLMWFRADPRVRWFESDPEAAGRCLIEWAGSGG